MNVTADQNNTVLDILREAISIEIYGREYYSIFSDIVEDKNAKAMFRGLSRYEAEHQELLEREYKNISGGPVDIRVLEKENKEKARRIFPEPLQPLNIAETADVLKLGIRTEEKSIELYANGAQKAENKSTRDLFLQLVHFEREHKRTLEDALYYLRQEGTWYGYSPPTLEG